MKSFKNIAAVVAITATALLSTAIPASADNAVPASGFTPDGVNHITAPGGSVTVQSYLNSGNFTPDGVNSIQDRQVTSIAMFTPDGVNQIGQVETQVSRAQILAYMNGGNHSPDGINNLQTVDGVSGPAIAMFTPDGVNQIGQVETQVSRAQVLAYMNNGNHSPDGVSNLQTAEGVSGPAIAMFTPDGVNQIGTVETQVSRAQVLAYMNGGNFTPDGVSNLQTAEGISGPAIAMFTPDGVNQIGQVETQVSRAQVLAYLNGGNFTPDGVNNVQAGSVAINGFTDVVIRYSETSNAAYVG